MRGFKMYHPLINFIYFISVISLAMFLMHPICLTLAFISSLIYLVKLKGIRYVLKNACLMLPILISTALINPAFNHKGATILYYFKSGNPLTLESIVYGLAAAVMLVTVIHLFMAYTEVVTSDKLIYLFGRLLPSISLILSMILGFVPKFKRQLKAISKAQKGIGRDLSEGNILQRIGQGLSILSILITWVLEESVQTADSMQSRGYGLKGRTTFSIFIFTKRDWAVLMYIIGLIVYITVGILRGSVYYSYFPVLMGSKVSIYSLSVWGAYFLLGLLPVMLEIGEEKRWKATQSNI